MILGLILPSMEKRRRVLSKPVVSMTGAVGWKWRDDTADFVGEGGGGGGLEHLPS